jgi:hypothetical protein
MAEPDKLSVEREIVEGLYDLTSDSDLGKIERLLNDPKIKVHVDETVNIPMRHIRFERPKQKV